MSASRLRVLALAPYPQAAPSTRVRITQFVPGLDSAGIDVHLHPFLDDTGYASARRGRGALGALAGASLRMVRVLEGLSGYDLVWIQRGAAPGLDTLVARALANAGTPYVFDFDDAVYLPQEGGRPWVEAVRRPGPSTRAFCQGATLVLAGSEHLAGYARRVVGRAAGNRVRVLPSVVDTMLLQPGPPRVQEVPVLGWVGTDTTVPYLESLAPSLAALARETRYRLVVVTGARRPRIPGVELDVLEWSLEGELEALQAMDVGLYPLDDTPWSRGKCGFKALQYLACGVPCVASPVGVLPGIVVPGRTGLLASSQADWVAACRSLLSDAPLRRTLGAQGSELVRASFSLDAALPMLVQAFDDAVSQRHA